MRVVNARPIPAQGYPTGSPSTRSIDEGKANISAEHASTGAHARIPGAHGHQERPARAEAAPGQGTQAADRQQQVAEAGESADSSARRRTGSSTMRFDRSERVRRHTDYQRIYKQGVRIHGRYLTLFLLSNGLKVSRLGVAATRKIGNAVVRNRAKRLVREIFRRNKPDPGFDVVVVPRRELVDVSLTDLEIEFQHTLARSLRRAR